MWESVLGCRGRSEEMWGKGVGVCEEVRGDVEEGVGKCVGVWGR